MAELCQQQEEEEEEKGEEEEEEDPSGNERVSFIKRIGRH